MLRQLCPALPEKAPYERRNVGEFLISGDENRLYEKLVAAFGIRRWVLFHRLQENYGHTSAGCKPRGGAYCGDFILCTSTSLPGSMRPELGLTQYLRRYHQSSGGIESSWVHTAWGLWF